MTNDLSILIPDTLVAETPLSDEEITLLKIKLWQLLGQRTERHTMSDSSSVPVETAEQLFNSICFTLQICLKARICSLSELLSNDNLQQILRAGQAEIEKKIAYGKTLLLEVMHTAPAIKNISYVDTVKGITAFFKSYDHRYFAHDIPADIDYQLCHPVSEKLLGIEYVNDYLQRLLVENRFIACFDIKKVKLLLNCYCRDYRGLLINLYDPVATNAIGLALCGKDVLPLDISAADRWTIMGIFEGLDKGEARAELSQAAQKVSDLVGIKRGFASEYLKKTAADLTPRIMAALAGGNLSNIFFTLPVEI